MVNLIKVFKTYEGNINCYVADSLSDRESLKDDPIGSLVFVIEDGQYYKKKSSGEWKKIYTGNERVPKNKGCIIINVDKEMTHGMPIAVFDPDENDIFCRLDRYDPTGKRIVIKDIPVGKYNDLKLSVLKDDRKYSGKILESFEVTADHVLEFDMILEPEFLPEYSGEIEVRVNKKDSPVFYRMLSNITTEEGLKDTTVVASFNPPIEASTRIRNDGEYKTIVISNIPLQKYKYLKVKAYRNDTVFKGFIKEPFEVKDNVINKLEMVLEEETNQTLDSSGMITMSVDKDLTGSFVDLTFNPHIENLEYTIFKNNIIIENVPNGDYKFIKVLSTKGTNKYSGFYKDPFTINGENINLNVSLEPEEIPVPSPESGIITLHVDKDITGGSAKVSFNKVIDKEICTVRKGDIVIENVPNGSYKSIKVSAIKGTNKYSGFYKDPFIVNGNNIDLNVSLELEEIPLPPLEGGMITIKVDKDITGGVSDVTFNPPIDGDICTVRKGDIVIENVPNNTYYSAKIVALKGDKKYTGFYKQPFVINNNSIEISSSLEEEKIPMPPKNCGMITIKVNKDMTGGILSASLNPNISGAICTINKNIVTIENIPEGKYGSIKLLGLKENSKFTGFYTKSFDIKNNNLEISMNIEEELLPTPPKNGGMLTLNVNKNMVGGIAAVSLNPNISGAICTINEKKIIIENVPSGTYNSIKLLGLRGNSKFTGFCKNQFLIDNNNIVLDVNVEEELLPTPPKNGGMLTAKVDKDLTGGLVAYSFSPNISGTVCTIHKDNVTIENVISGDYKSFKIIVIKDDKRYTGFYKDGFKISNGNTEINVNLEEEIIPIPEPNTTGLVIIDTKQDITGSIAAAMFDPPINGASFTVKKNEVIIENIPNGKYKSIELFIFKGNKQFTGSYKKVLDVNNNEIGIDVTLKEGITPGPSPVGDGKVKVNASDSKPGYLIEKISGAKGSGITFDIDEKEEVMVAHFNVKEYEGKILETMDSTSALSMLDHNFGTGCIAGTIMLPSQNLTIKKDITKVRVYSLGGALSEFRVSIYRRNPDNGNLHLVGYTNSTKFSADEIIGKDLTFIHVSAKEAKIETSNIYYVCIHKFIADPVWGKLLGLTGFGNPTITDGDIQFTIKDIDAGYNVTNGKNPANIIEKSLLQPNVYAAYTYFRISNP